jgi:magnesium-protoporphyrin IX monomethyl ester (oxidative) cyclase
VDRCADLDLKLKQIAEGVGAKVWKTVRKLPVIAGIVGDLLRLYLIKPIDAEAMRATVR